MNNKDKSLTGKVAIVTGGGNGVGRGIALALADAGADVVICGRTEASLVRVAEEIQARGAKVLVVRCDVTLVADLDRLINSTIESFGTIDILINNAALIPHGSLLTIDESVIQGAWDAGPLAALRLMRRAHPYLTGDGAIVNVSSGIAIADKADNRGIYAATKAALNAISRAAANEWGGDGIRTNVIMPFARTEKVNQFFANEPLMANNILSQNPLGRVGDPELDIGRAVVFLVGSGGSYINGVTLPLDGGSSYVR